MRTLEKPEAKQDIKKDQKCRMGTRGKRVVEHVFKCVGEDGCGKVYAGVKPWRRRRQAETMAINHIEAHDQGFVRGDFQGNGLPTQKGVDRLDAEQEAEETVEAMQVPTTASAELIYMEQTVKSLRDLAASRGLRRYSKATKPELIKMLTDNDKENNNGR